MGVSDKIKSAYNKCFNFLKFDSKKIVNFFVVLFFYTSIIIATLRAGYKIVIETFQTTHGKDGDLKILEFVEHIFLYLIPIFILLGFYNYYKLELRVKLLDLGEPSGVDRKTMMDSIHLTKSLFLSSIISYVIIKSIEKVFFYDDTPDLKSLLSYGGLLIILMVFNLFQSKISH